ncbi:homoserine dehydrogenase [Trichoderma gamsii]|uniref:Homoserine dehydrogenase n=1 Tax=Trichoderma gamsii TaxID=398673 RepID=A0A2P4ZMW0_9HYPO|nr:homoserine dehydrogenase [Trichoderma gamsii]PON25632.1 homoserine dehydrogenase [Trichoderma gamsii]
MQISQDCQALAQLLTLLTPPSITPPRYRSRNRHPSFRAVPVFRATYTYTYIQDKMAAVNQVYIAIIGAGGVGKCFLSQLQTLAARKPSPKLSLCYISTSRKALYNVDYSPVSLDGVSENLASSTQAPPPLAQVIDYLAAAPAKVVLVDNTSSQDVADAYPLALSRGLSIVTPNKKAFSGSYKLWQDIFTAAATSGAKVYHESSVGAGLPVISTLKDLVETGDKVTKIEGVFSGTMSFLFNSFAPTEGQGGKWSEEVKKAKALGYTEPDPRDDLNGLDVARKLTILARLAGLPVESPTSFPTQSLIPKELESCATGEEFLQQLPAFDQQMEDIKATAEKAGKVVRFVGSIDAATQQVKVGLEQFDRSHPIASLKGSDNIISFYTERYGSNPLIIQGAGAGGDVTAMGVTGDLIKVLSQIA